MLDFANHVLYNLEGTKHWTPDPDITPEALDAMRVEVFVLTIGVLQQPQMAVIYTLTLNSLTR